MKSAIAVSVLDQGILSAQSLLVSILLIHFGDENSVGRFALAMALYFALLTVQDSLLGSVLTNRVFGRAPSEQRRVVSQLATIGCTYGITGAVIITAIVVEWLQFDLNLALATVAMVVAGLFRELVRAVTIATNDMRRCLTIDTVAAICSVLILPVFWQFNSPPAACLWAIATAHGLAALVFQPRLHITPRTATSALMDFADLYRWTKWSLIIGVSRETQSRTFLFVIEMIRGLAATATIHVGRLLISPVLLFVMAVGRIVMPRMAHHFHQDESGKAYSIIWFTSAVLTVIAVGYGLAVFLAWPVLFHKLGLEKYPDIENTMIAWFAYAIATVPLWSLLWTFRALEQFKLLAIATSINCGVVLIAMSLMLLPVPLYSAVVVLTLGDICLAGFLAWHLLGLRTQKVVII